MYETKEVVVNGIEYTLQKLPVREALKIRQKWQLGNGLTDDIVMMDECFEHIVIKPKVKLDDFDNIEDAEMLAAECIFFQYMEKKEKEKLEEV